MIPEHSEKSRTNPNCELRLGVASWAKGDKTEKSVKFAWLDKNGKVARGGEFPVKALKPEQQRLYEDAENYFVNSEGVEAHFEVVRRLTVSVSTDAV